MTRLKQDEAVKWLIHGQISFDFLTFDFFNHSMCLASASIKLLIYVPTVKGTKHNTQLNDTQMNVPWHLILFDFSQKFNH